MNDSWFRDYYLKYDAVNSVSVIGTAINLWIGLALLASLVGAVTDYFQRKKPALWLIRSMKQIFVEEPELLHDQDRDGPADRDVAAPPSLHHHHQQHTSAAAAAAASSVDGLAAGVMLGGGAAMGVHRQQALNENQRQPQQPLPPMSPEQKRRRLLRESAQASNGASGGFLVEGSRGAAAPQTAVGVALAAHTTSSADGGGGGVNGGGGGGADPPLQWSQEQQLRVLHGESGLGSRMFDDKMAGVFAGAGATGPRGGGVMMGGMQLPPITHGVGGVGAMKFPPGTPRSAPPPPPKTQGSSGDDFRWSRIGV